MTLRRIAAPAAGAIVGIAAFAAGLGLELANPAHTSWVLVEGDHRLHQLGWHMFGHERWTIPPGVIATYGHPVGTSIGYTDSIAALAFPFKLVRAFVSADLQYLGLWLLMAYTLQGVFAVLLLRRWTPHAVLQVLGAAMIVLSPPLLFRYGHPALSAHWLLLASLLLYFSGTHLGTRVILGWACVAAIAAATHPYLTLMILALASAHHGRIAMAGTAGAIVRAAASLAVCAITAGLVFWLTGYFVVGQTSDIQGAGLGDLSMNGLALMMPDYGSALFGWGPFAYATTGQYEGYAYLGAGALLLLAIVLITGAATRRLRLNLGERWQHLPLVLVGIVLTAMALSPKVTAGHAVLFEYSESWWGPLTVFRASGRMFWPVFYLLLLGVLCAAVKWWRFRTAALALTTAVALQAADVSALYTQLRQVRQRAWHSPLQSPLWSIVPHYAHVVLMPTNMCTVPTEVIDYTPFVLLAGRAGATINAGVAARYDASRLAAYCDEAAKRWREGDVRDDELYVLRPALAGHLKGVARKPLLCLAADAYQVCFTADSYRHWQQSHDVVRSTLPAEEEIARFHVALESIYRDDLGRPAVPSSFAGHEASAWIVTYLAYRVTGCAHDEAAAIIRQQLEGANPLRLCRAGYVANHDLPPPTETLRFHVDMAERANAAPGQSVSATTHVDAEGRAVWLQEYVRRRRAGVDEAEATRAVRDAIRRIAGR
jgi:hypothetical protein